MCYNKKEPNTRKETFFMLLCFQVPGCCLLFFLLVRCAVKNDGLNCIYFYPKPTSTKPGNGV